MTDDRLSYLLDTWREYLNDPDLGLGYPSTAAGIRWRPGDDFDQMVESLDHTMALAVDTCVDDLPLNEKAAVYIVVINGGRHSGMAVWRFREPIDVIYERARGMLKIDLKRRGVE